MFKVYGVIYTNNPEGDTLVDTGPKHTPINRPSMVRADEYPPHRK